MLNTTLTKREKEILLLICGEQSSAAIAQNLQISARTVAAHRKNIAFKVGTNSPAGWVKFAIRRGMLKDYFFKKNP